MKAVFHMDESDKWNLVSVNVKNLKKEAADIKVVVVVNAKAVQLFTNQAMQLHTDVSYHICKNSLVANHIDESSLIEGVTIVSSGVMDIVQLQEAGYRYIKP